MEPITVGFGDTVRLSCTAVGVVRFIGYTEFKRNILYYGIDLHESIGKHDGKYQNRRYFKCDKLHGIFVQRKQIERVIERRYIDKPFSIGQKVQIIDSLQNNKKIGKGRLRFVGLTAFDNFRHYLYGVELDKNLKEQYVEQISMNTHIYLIDSDDHVYNGEDANRYFDADAKRSIFVRRDQLKVIPKDKERRHSTKDYALRYDDSLRHRFGALDCRSGALDTWSGFERHRSRSEFPWQQTGPKKQRTLKKRIRTDGNYGAKKRRESVSKSNVESVSKSNARSTRTERTESTATSTTGSSSNGLVVLSSYESLGDFNGCSLTPELNAIPGPICRSKRAMSALTLGDAVTMDNTELPQERRLRDHGNGNRDRAQTQIQTQRQHHHSHAHHHQHPHALSHHQQHHQNAKSTTTMPVNPRQSEALRLKKRHSTPIRGDERRKMLMMSSREMAIREDKAVCFGEDVVDDDYFEIINDRDKFRRFVDRKHFYYHHQFTKDSQDRDAVELMAVIKERSMRAPPPSMGSYFSSKSRINRRKKRALPSRPREYAVQIHRRPMGFYIESKRLNERGIVNMEMGRERGHEFKMVNAYISSIVEEQWHSALLIGSQLLSINGEDITGLSFSKIFRKLTTEPLPFMLRLAAPTERRRDRDGGGGGGDVKGLKDDEDEDQEEDEEESDRSERGQTMDETKLHMDAVQRRNKYKFRFKLF